MGHTLIPTLGTGEASPAPSLSLSRFLGQFAAILVFTLLAIAPPAFAQQPEGSAHTAEGQDASQDPAGAAQSLVDILNDPEARDRLIQNLLDLANTPAGSGETSGEGDQAQSPQEDSSIARQFASATQEIAEGVSETLTQLSSSLASLGELSDLDAADRDQVLEAALLVLIVAAVTLASYWLLRLVAVRFFSRMSREAPDRTLPRTLLTALLAAVVDAANVLGAWAIGYGVALLIGESGQIDVRQSLFLNAFLVVEMTKVALRVLLSPNIRTLRYKRLSEETARYWYFWLSRIIGVLGYGMLLLVPVVNNNISAGVGRAFAVLIALTALVIAIRIIFQNRLKVRAGILSWTRRWAGEGSGDPTVLVVKTLAVVWHLIALAYVLGIFLVWLINPAEALQFVTMASVKTVAAVLAGVIGIGLISWGISGGARLPDDVKLRLPMLEKRLNAVVPALLRVVRFIVLVVVLGFALDSWTVVNLSGWLESQAGSEFVMRLVSAGLILLFSVAFFIAVMAWIDQRLDPSVGKVATARERTLIALFRNAFTVALAVIVTMVVLSELGLDIGPLLAGAGVLGLAIGFGSQKLVQDIITGAFIQIENAMNEGDVVTLAGITGVVERLTVRSVGLRDLSGIYHLIPFSSVDTVSNFMRGFSFHVAEIGVAYRENIGQVKALMNEAFDRLKETEHGANMLEDALEMHGLTQFGDSAIMVRGRIRCAPGTQWAIGRAYNEIIKEIFDRDGIEIPFPHMTLYWGQDKDGSAPPLIVQNSGRGKDDPSSEGNTA